MPASTYTITGSPVTSAGNIAVSFANQNQNTVFAGPAGASPAAPTWRQLSSTALSDTVARTAWTPTFTFATPGDVAVTYATQVGYYYRVGSMLFWWAAMNITGLTYTTASGAAYIQGWPVPIFNVAGIAGSADINFMTPITWPAGTTQLTGNLSIIGANTTMQIFARGPTPVSTTLTTTSFPSGTGVNMAMTGFFPVV